jgi:hypothetical protein
VGTIRVTFILAILVTVLIHSLANAKERLTTTKNQPKNFDIKKKEKQKPHIKHH